MTLLPFQKLVGAGNDFVFLLKEDLGSQKNFATLAKKLCDRRFGIGADGLVVLKKGGTYDFEWEFFNSDGSEAEMCGNAARCVVRYGKENFGWNDLNFKTAIGLVTGKNISETETQVSWEVKQTTSTKMEVTTQSFPSLYGELINTGVPHFVVNEDLFPLKSEDCLEVQEHKAFAPMGVNVTLYRPSDADQPALTRSFERGVRDFTYACGTGVIATALVLGVASANKGIELKTPGGLLHVQSQKQRVFLTGPALSVYRGQIPTRGLYV